MRPMHETPNRCHLETRRASLLFDESKLNRMRMLLAPHVNRNYLLRFYAFFDHINPISTILMLVGIRVRVMRRTSNSCLSMTYPRPNRRNLECTRISYLIGFLRIDRSQCLSSLLDEITNRRCMITVPYDLIFSWLESSQSMATEAIPLSSDIFARATLL